MINPIHKDKSTQIYTWLLTESSQVTIEMVMACVEQLWNGFCKTKTTFTLKGGDFKIGFGVFTRITDRQINSKIFYLIKNVYFQTNYYINRLRIFFFIYFFYKFNLDLFLQIKDSQLWTQLNQFTNCFKKFSCSMYSLESLRVGRLGSRNLSLNFKLRFDQYNLWPFFSTSSFLVKIMR